ncbi:Homeodomain-like protein [Chytridium lagenaria]|nr:Homeodomain-like protein [Chytridium lagenaria]
MGADMSFEALKLELADSPLKMRPTASQRQPTPDATPNNSPSPSFHSLDRTLGAPITAPPSPMTSLSGSASPRSVMSRGPSASPVPAPQTMMMPRAYPQSFPPIQPLHIIPGVHPLSSANMNGNLYPTMMYPAYTPALPSSSSRKRQRSVRTSTYNKWSPEEDALLRSAVARHGTQGKWAIIAASIPGRTPIQCSTRYTGALNPRIHKGKWSSEEDALLRTAFNDACLQLLSERGPDVDITPSSSLIPWQKIAEIIPGRTGVQCIARYQEALDPEIRKGKWNVEEDALLKKGLRLHGKGWVKIAGLIRGRTQRQCRTRWLQIRERLEAEGIFVCGKDEGDEGMDA